MRRIRTRAKKNKSKDISLNILLILSISFLLYVIVTFALTPNKNRFFVLGFKPTVVLSGSMEPEFLKNGLLLINRCKYSDVKVGDVVAFEYKYSDSNEKILVTHKVIEISDEGIQTQGIANEKPDFFKVTQDMVCGKVIWHTNITSNIFNNPFKVLIYSIFFVAIIIFILLLVLLRSAYKDQKKLTSSEKNEILISKIKEISNRDDEESAMTMARIVSLINEKN